MIQLSKPYNRVSSLFQGATWGWGEKLIKSMAITLEPYKTLEQYSSLHCLSRNFHSK